MKLADHIRSLAYKRIAVGESSYMISESFARMLPLQTVPLVMVHDVYYILRLGVTQVQLQEPVLASLSYGAYLEWLLGQANIRSLAGKMGDSQLLPVLTYVLRAFASETAGGNVGDVSIYLEDEMLARQWASQSDFDLQSYLTATRVARGQERVRRLSKYGLELLKRYGSEFDDSHSGGLLSELRKLTHVLQVEIGREAGVAPSSGGYDAVYRVNWPEALRCDDRWRLPLVVIKPLRPQAIPLALWQDCWQDSYFDFSVEAWEKQKLEEQIAYARAYQEWYGQSNSLAVEINIALAGLTLTMRLVPPGQFLMGSPPDEPESLPGESWQQMLLPQCYYLGKYAVTQEQWQAVMGNNPARFKESGLQAPVENVSWEDSAKFCKQAGLELPTEVQWEYACRAGTTTAFNFSANITPAQVNYHGWFPYQDAAEGEVRGKTVAVASMNTPNAWGLHEMHGNVWEWCQDLKDGYVESEQRVIRGGSWIDFACYCRSASRLSAPPSYTDGILGLRAAEPIRKVK